MARRFWRRGKFLILVVALSALWSRPVAAQSAFTVPSLPATLTVAWDAEPAAAQVTSYTLTLDQGAPVTVTPPVPGPTAAPVTQPITITTAGSHTVSVTATNASGTSGPATLNFTIVILVVPQPVANLRLSR